MNKLSEELLPCPFCGGMPIMKLVGNDHTKKRSVEIECSSCRIKRIDSAIKYNHEWIKDVAVSYWNSRSLDAHSKWIESTEEKLNLNQVNRGK